MNDFVLDASALLALVHGEPGAERVRTVLGRAVISSATGSVSRSPHVSVPRRSLPIAPGRDLEPSSGSSCCGPPETHMIRSDRGISHRGPSQVMVVQSLAAAATDGNGIQSDRWQQAMT